MPTPRWTLYDPFADETYEFQVNPKEGGSPPFKRQMTYTNTSAADGKTLMFEGRPDPSSLVLQFSGTILHQGQLDALTEWVKKRNQILLTDDLGRTYWVVLTEFTPKRERAVHYPWKHSYTASATIVDWP